MLSLKDFKESKLNSSKITGGYAITTLNGVANGDTVDGDIFIDNTTGEIYCGGDGHYGPC